MEDLDSDSDIEKGKINMEDMDSDSDMDLDFYTNKPGTVFFFNCLNDTDGDCKENIRKLSLLFFSNGYNCIYSSQVNSLDDIKNVFNATGQISGLIIIFFFGYGYGDGFGEDYMYLGTTANESISCLGFCFEVDKIRVQGNPIILFSNFSTKPRQKETMQYDPPISSLIDIIHYCVIFIDGTENSSLLTNSFIDEIHISDFNHFMRTITKRLKDSQSNCRYYTIHYGVDKLLEFPNNLQKTEENEGEGDSGDGGDL